MEQVNEVGGGLIVEGFVSEQKDGLELDLCGTGSQWRFWGTVVMWSLPYKMQFQ